MEDEFKGYMKQMAKNLAREAQWLKEFLKDKDESYILSNPEEVASELIASGNTAGEILGAYNTLCTIRETGFTPIITYREVQKGE